jgi:hypothetical protein
VATLTWINAFQSAAALILIQIKQLERRETY